MEGTDEAGRTRGEREQSGRERTERRPLVNAHYTEDAFYLQDERNPEAWIHTEYPVEIRQ